MTILYWWSREYALEMGLEGIGRAIVFGGEYHWQVPLLLQFTVGSTPA